MPNPTRAEIVESEPRAHAFAGTVLLVVAYFLLLASGEYEWLQVLAIVCASAGLYLLIAGGVARGIALSRE